MYTIIMNGYETFNVSISEKWEFLDRYIESLFFWSMKEEKYENVVSTIGRRSITESSCDKGWTYI